MELRIANDAENTTAMLRKIPKNRIATEPNNFILETEDITP